MTMVAAVLRNLLPAVLILAPAAARAQAENCAVPDRLPAQRIEGPTRDQPRRVMPVTHYLLAVSWSPQYCRGREDRAGDAFQCANPAGGFGFVRHGLWPESGTSWPQYCRPARLVPERLVRENLCLTPSAQLIQHEWEKHGTCMSPSARSYFATSTRLYRALRFPDMTALARRPRLTVSQFATAFAAANRGMRADMLRVNLSRGEMLDEVWICFDKRLRYARCEAEGSPPGATVTIMPRG